MKILDPAATAISYLSDTSDEDENGLSTTDGLGNVIANTLDGDRMVSAVLKDIGGTTVSSESEASDRAGEVTNSVFGDLAR